MDDNATFTAVRRISLSHHLNQSMVTKWRLREVLLSKQCKRQILKDTRLCREELGKRSAYAFSLDLLVY